MPAQMSRLSVALPPIAVIVVVALTLGFSSSVNPSTTPDTTRHQVRTVNASASAHGRTDDTVDPVSERLSAPVMAARPNDGWVFTGRNIKWSTQESPNSPVCHTVRPICVHWTDNGDDAPPAADSDGDDIPDQAESTLAAAGTSWNVIVNQLGFRAPLADRRSRINGGGPKFDIYLADTGAKGLSGYTSSDDRRLTKKSDYKYRDVSAFTVVDNDFRAGQFPDGTPLDNMRVTVAHELSHASQFAYDYKEDRWFSEGTATWVEDEVFDDINLNRDALKQSPLSKNFTSLDFGRNGHEYGSWIFLRYLSEKFGTDIIKRAWRFADDSATQVSTDRMKTFSMRALGRAVHEQKSDLGKQFSLFARDNLRPAKTYEEGDTYPKPTAFTIGLNKGDDTGWQGVANDHLSTTYVTYLPGDNVRRTGTIKILFNGPYRKFGPRVLITVRFTSGKSHNFAMKLDRKGDGAKRVGFGRNKVAGVDVSIVNTSTRMRDCFKHSTPYSCSGTPKDDQRPVHIRARL
ncbi:MAG TPA: MXAN_6640 family putative metalloprotease [Actinomycetes bacterium]|nr:MXAN_6640 family putative metalloprotease [Actinomycetes bacterium]